MRIKVTPAVYLSTLFSVCLAGCAALQFPIEPKPSPPPSRPTVGVEGRPLLATQYGYYHSIDGCDPQTYSKYDLWVSHSCNDRSTMAHCLLKQIQADKRACREGPLKDAELEKTALCRDITKLKIGMKKKKVVEIFGEPTYSKMSTCGGAEGVKRWSCESVTYSCKKDADSWHALDMSKISVWYGGDLVNSWE